MAWHCMAWPEMEWSIEGERERHLPEFSEAALLSPLLRVGKPIFSAEVCVDLLPISLQSFSFSSSSFSLPGMWRAVEWIVAVPPNVASKEGDKSTSSGPWVDGEVLLVCSRSGFKTGDGLWEALEVRLEESEALGTWSMSLRILKSVVI